MATVVDQSVNQVVVRNQFGVHQQLVPDAAGCTHQGTQGIEDEGGSVLEEGTWSQQMTGLNEGIVLRSLGKHHQVHGGSLRVSGVVYLIEAGIRQDVVDHGGDVDGADFVPVEVPELVAVQRDDDVVPRVDVTTGIAQPHIVSGIREQVGQGVVRSGGQPAVRVTEQSVLQQDWRSLLVLVLQLVGVRDAEQGQHIAILGGHLVSLRGISVRTDPLVRLDDLAQTIVRLLGED